MSPLSLDHQSKRAGIELSPSQRASIKDGNAAAVMLGAGDSYISAYGIFLHGSPFELSLLMSVPQYCGALAQMAGLWSLRVIKSRRRLTAVTAALNGAMWIVIALAPFLFDLKQSAVMILTILFSLYQAVGAIGGPAWNSLMGELVPAEIRGRFFGLRSRTMGFFTFASMVGAGQLLHLFAEFNATQLGFLVIFSVAAISRFISAYYVARYDDPPQSYSPETYFSLWQFIRRTPHSNFARFVFYIGVMNGALAFAAPFFTVYMLRDLSFSYLEFTIATATVMVVQFLTLQYWGKLTDLFGAKMILNVIGYAVSLSPFLWTFSENFYYILWVQVFSGFVWAGFNLAATTFIFNAVTPGKRARCTAYQSVVNGTLMLIGALGGGIVAEFAPRTVSLFGFEWTPLSPLYTIFFISGVLRIAASFFFLPRFKEVAAVQPIGHRELLFRITGLRPMYGLTFGLLTGREPRKHTKVVEEIVLRRRESLASQDKERAKKE